MAAREMEQLSNERLQVDSNNQTHNEEHIKNRVGCKENFTGNFGGH